MFSHLCSALSLYVADELVLDEEGSEVRLDQDLLGGDQLRLPVDDDATSGLDGLPMLGRVVVERVQVRDQPVKKMIVIR
jgi:hypothetical protein